MTDRALPRDGDLLHPADDVQRVRVGEVPIAAVTLQEAMALMDRWVADPNSRRTVTFTTSHIVVEADSDERFLSIMRGFDLNCPDGAPIAWMAGMRTHRSQPTVSGPDFMPAYCEHGVTLGHRHFIYGGKEGVAEAAAEELRRRYPGIQIAGWYSPPFRPLTEEEDAEVCRLINDSDADLVWICLGCPKQEWWMYNHRPKLEAPVLLAVGQAVDVLAGSVGRAPRLVRKLGMEWFYRLLKEPRRLWKRYLVGNTRFVLKVLKESLTGSYKSDPVA